MAIAGAPREGEAASAAQEPGLVVRLDEDLPERLAVGRGNCLFLSGVCSHAERPIERLEIALDGVPHPAAAQGLHRPDGPGAFCAYLPFEPLGEPRRVVVELVVSFRDGGTARRPLGEVAVDPQLPSIDAELAAGRGDGPLVAICMATFEPPADLLARQIDSLRRQTHGRWICLISDDRSSPAGFERLRSIVGEDRRFFVSASPRRLGFYRNFERALSMVPEGVDFVALCDQDDSWHPDKLAALVERIGESNLAFSDMRVIDETGTERSATFWSYKRNNYINLASLLIDNTVTGAASLFRRDLLDVALPFPPRLESSYHDHWIASVALATGSISYLDRPLYDYVQHGATATPVHPAATEAQRSERPPFLSRRGVELRLEEGRASYFRDVCRVALQARILEMRGARGGSLRKRRAIRRVAALGRPREPAVWLALRSLRQLVGLNETRGFERVLLKGVLWRRVSARR
jgi:hypothetical protein